MDLSDRHLHFLRIEQGLISGIINVVINGAIAWALLRSYSEIPLWGETSMGVDLLATAFLLPFISCLIVSRIIRGHVEHGKLPPLSPHQIATHGFHRRAVWVRGLLLGLLGVVFAAGPVVALLALADANPVAMPSFVGYKAVWAGLLAMTLTPILAWWALCDASGRFPAKD
jgi:hypothetical protein